MNEILELVVVFMIGGSLGALVMAIVASGCQPRMIMSEWPKACEKCGYPVFPPNVELRPGDDPVGELRKIEMFRPARIEPPEPWACPSPGTPCDVGPGTGKPWPTDKAVP